MKILIVMPDLPFPIHKNGVCSTINHLIRYWKEKQHEVDIIYFGDRDNTAEDKLVKEYRIKIFHRQISGRELTIKIGRKLFLKPRNSWQYNFSSCESFDVNSYDTIFFGTFIAGFLYNKLLHIELKKIIFFEADSLSLYYKRSSLEANNLVRILYDYLQMILIFKIEQHLYNKVDTTIFVSEIDLRYTEQLICPNNKTCEFLAIPIGVDIKQTRNKTFDFKENEINICFSGIMDYDPNIKAVEYILYHIIPKLNNSGINYKIHLLGKNPKREWNDELCVKQGTVIITGFVEEFDKYLANMDLYISPLFLGTGMKNKILQAMGVGLPIICSEVSAEGILELKNEKNVFICDKNPDSWVEKIKMLSSDVKLMENFSKCNRDIISNSYNWKQVAEKVLNV